MTPLAYLEQRATDDWLIGYDNQEFFTLATQTLQILRQAETETPSIVLLAERHPVKFLAHFIAACAANCSVFLGNPDWTAAEWQQVFQQVQPDYLWGPELHQICQTSPHAPSPTPYPLSPLPLIHIPTGGTSGTIRFAIHTWETLMSSVAGFREYFALASVNSLCVLPLYHVSGLMQFLRSFTSGGKLVVRSFKSLQQGDWPEIDPATYFLSLVPTQLQRLMQDANQLLWLSRFQTVLLGGAPAWSELFATARQHRIRLAPTYGMTETASQIATLKPEEFLAGNTSCGRVLPHAHITICHPDGNPQQAGALTIQARSLALGYYPDRWFQDTYEPDDIGCFDQQGYLHLVGRCSDKIITGGENVFPAEVESAIRATGWVEDVCVVGIPDQEWGERVTAVYVPVEPTIAATTLQDAVSSSLSRFKQPKHWLAVERLPRNAQGKINRQQVKHLVLLAQVPTAATIAASLEKPAVAIESPD